MGTKIKIIVSLLYLLASPAWGAEPAQIPGENVEELLALAQQRNPELLTANLEADAAVERIGSAGALPDPNFRMELRDFTNRSSGAAPSVLPGKVANTYFRVMQPLPFWGKRGLKRDIAEAEARQAQARVGMTSAELATKIKTNFAQYYLLSHSIKLTQEILELTLNLERIAKSRYETGLAPQQDVIRAQVEQTGLRRDLVMLETERHHSMSRINTLLFRSPQAPLAEPLRIRALPAASKLEFTTLADRVRSLSPDMITLDSQVSAAEKSRDLVLKNRYPDFAVGLAPTQVRNEITEWELMLEFNIPLQQGSRRGQEREAGAMLAAMQARREAATNQILGELAEYIISLEASRRVEALTTHSLLPQAEATRQAAYVGYQNGKVDFATLLDAQRQILKARQDVLNVQAQAQLSLAQIERLLGEEL